MCIRDRKCCSRFRNTLKSVRLLSDFIISEENTKSKVNVREIWRRGNESLTVNKVSVSRYFLDSWQQECFRVYGLKWVIEKPVSYLLDYLQWVCQQSNAVPLLNSCTRYLHVSLLNNNLFLFRFLRQNLYIFRTRMKCLCYGCYFVFTGWVIAKYLLIFFSVPCWLLNIVPVIGYLKNMWECFFKTHHRKMYSDN